jgi:DNA uptake protein ComE-like DNA-binding protein
MQIILFAPPNWMPVIVRDKHKVNELLLKGYRRSLPGEQPPENTAIYSPKIETQSGEPLKINQCELKDLVAINGIGTVNGKKIIASRPYQVAEDLYAVSDRVDWNSLNIDYSI